MAAAMSPAAGWWLARVRGFVAYLLARALGHPHKPALGTAAGRLSPGSSGRPPYGSAGAWLLRRPGTLLLSRTHVDLYLPMETAEIAIRRSGLDRDPGWAPDLGHIVLFHFL